MENNSRCTFTSGGARRRPPPVCFSSMNSPEELGDHSQGHGFSQWSQAEYTRYRRRRIVSVNWPGCFCFCLALCHLSGQLLVVVLTKRCTNTFVQSPVRSISQFLNFYFTVNNKLNPFIKSHFTAFRLCYRAQIEMFLITVDGSKHPLILKHRASASPLLFQFLIWIRMRIHFPAAEITQFP